MKITVWDDDLEAATGWRDEIEQVLAERGVAGSVVAHEREEIRKELQVLHGRRRQSVEGEGADENAGPSELDDAGILVVDNDLFALDEFVDLSAEMVAARVLVYANCAYVVVLNLSPDIDFDLSLVGRPASKADLHVNDQFVSNPGLWVECPREDYEFRPWTWPLLVPQVEMQRARAEELEQLLANGDADIPILDYFSFDDTARDRLSRSTRGFLHPRRDIREVSFRDFLTGNADAIDVKDGLGAISGGDVGVIARICARRLSKWLSHFVLGPQDILIDLPHLLSEFPFLVSPQQRGDTDFWNLFARLEAPPLGELVDDVSPALFKMSKWFDRPVFWKEKFDTDENIDRLVEAASEDFEWPVFCEDASAFFSPEGCREFVAGYHAASDNRFVRWFGNDQQVINYGPHSRLAM